MVVQEKAPNFTNKITLAHGKDGTLSKIIWGMAIGALQTMHGEIQ